MARMRDRLDAPVLIGVGAAFDFHAGLVPQAPALAAAARPRVAVPPGPGAAPPVAALPALQPALRDGLRPPVRAPPQVPARALTRPAPILPRACTTSPSSGSAASACRSRSRFADAGLSRARRRQGRRAPRDDPLRADAVQGAGHRSSCCERGVADGTARAQRARRRGGRRPTRSCSRSGRRASRTSRSTWATSASVLDDLLPHPARRATCSCCARPSPPGRPTSSPATSRSTAASGSARTCSSPTCPERIAADRFLDRDRDAAVHRRRGRRGLGRARRGAVRAARRADRPDHAGAGRARQDLDQHPALRHLRAAQPADDGLRALRRERLRGHRADQPRLSARRDGAARASPPAPACARTSRSPRSARTPPGCCSPSRGCTRACRCSWSTG